MLMPMQTKHIQAGGKPTNSNIRRFVLKGLNKVNLEWGLHCIAHNMRKMVTATV